MVYWFDILICGLTLLLGIKGAVNGLVKELFGLLGIVGGVLIASRLANKASAFISSNIHNINNEDLGKFIGFLLVLIIFWILCISIGFIIAKIVKMSGLEILDRLGGFAFGCVKVFLIFAILFFCVNELNFIKQKIEKFSKDSFIVPVLEATGAFIMNNERVKQVVQETGQNLDLEINTTQGEQDVY